MSKNRNKANSHGKANNQSAKLKCPYCFSRGIKPNIKYIYLRDKYGNTVLFPADTVYLCDECNTFI